MTDEARPFEELEIFEPHLQTQNLYKKYIKQIREILLNKALEKAEVKTIAEIDPKKVPYFGLWPPQVEAQAKGFFLEHDIANYKFFPSVVVATGTGTGKCITGDSLLFTDRGLTQIDSITDHQVITMDNTQKFHLKKHATWINEGIQPTIKLVTQRGYNIEGTYEHPLIILTPDGTLEFKRLDEIEVGSYVAIKHSLHNFGKNNYPLIGRLLGLLVGDGIITDSNSHKNRLGFVNSNPFLLSNYLRIIKTLYNRSCRCGNDKRNNTKVYWVYSKAIRDELRIKFGLNYATAKTKEIPISILTADQETVIQFLQGLFDTDGSIHKGYIEYSTASIKLAHQVHILLLNFGVVSRFSTKLVKGVSYYRILISGEGVYLFEREIGFQHRDKQRKLHQYTTTHKTNTNINVLPYNGTTILKQSWQEFIDTSQQNMSQSRIKSLKNEIKYETLRSYFKGHRDPSIHYLKNYCEVMNKIANNEALLKLKKIIDMDIFWDEVASLQFSENNVYDLVIPETHNFIANGFINHNTDIAALMALKAILEPGRGKVLYTVPLRALAREKEGEFRNYWSNITKPNGENIQISAKYTDIENLATRSYSKYDWVICTNEKADSLIRHHNPFMDELALLVVDEGDFISDESRGPTLEAVITHIKTDPRYKKVQIIFLSATIPLSSVRPLALWLNIRPNITKPVEDYFLAGRNIDNYFIRTLWRPVKLVRGVYVNGIIHPINCEKKKLEIGKEIDQVQDDDILNLTLDTLKTGGQVLIFRKSRGLAVTTAEKIAKMIAHEKLLSAKEFDALSDIDIRRDRDEAKTSVEDQLLRMIKVGVAFHHAGVPSTALGKIEKAFSDRLLKVIVTTTTLARGVNLPARTVIVGDMHRFDPKRPWLYPPGVPIKVSEYQQFIGRAGRYGKENIGYGYSIAESDTEASSRIKLYICNQSEPLESQLYNDKALRKHLLAFLAIRKKESDLNIKNFLRNTFLYQTEELFDDFWDKVDDILEKFDKNQFALKQMVGTEKTFEITDLGNKTSGFLLDPLSVVYLKIADKLIAANLEHGEDIDVVGFLHLICFIEENGFIQSRDDQLIKPWRIPEEVQDYFQLNPEALLDKTKVGEKEIIIEELISGKMVKRKEKVAIYQIPAIEDIFTDQQYSLYVALPQNYSQEDYKYFLQALYTALVLRDWINEIPEDIICKKYHWVLPGDIFHKHETIEHMATVFGQLDDLPDFGADIRAYCDMMYWRLRKGIKPELISLCKLPEIGRTRGRRLYNAGYHTKGELARALLDPVQFPIIAKLVPKSVAKRLKERLSRILEDRKKAAELRKEEDAIKAGTPPTPIGAVLEEVGEEQIIKDYYDKVLDVMTRLWADNKKQPLAIKNIAIACNAELHMTTDDVEYVIRRMINDGVVWVPKSTYVQFLE
jgi:helicase